MIELVSNKLSVPYRNLRYLVVDDDPDQRYLVARTLSTMGLANVVEATSGREALEVLARVDEPVDVVISDLQMPDVDGMELIRKIGEKALPVSVILVSALDDVLVGSAATMTQAYGVRIIGTIGKPVTQDKVFTVLRNYVPQDAVVESSLDRAFPLEPDQVLAGISAGQFEPFFQPKVELATGRVVGAEGSRAGVIRPTACSARRPFCRRSLAPAISTNCRGSCSRSPRSKPDAGAMPG